MAAEAEARAFGGTPAKEAEADGDTFLTDLLVGGKKQPSESSLKQKATKSAAKPPTNRREALNLDQDSEMQDFEDELRDVVFDYENSQAMVAIADDFLKGNDSNPFADPFRGDAQSQYSKNSKASDKSRIQQNIAGASKYDHLKVKLLQDRLNEKEKARLESLLKEIEDNLDGLMQEKQEYHKQ